MVRTQVVIQEACCRPGTLTRDGVVEVCIWHDRLRFLSMSYIMSMQSITEPSSDSCEQRVRAGAKGAIQYPELELWLVRHEPLLPFLSPVLLPWTQISQSLWKYL
jgi:hypothetical protein